MILSDFHPLTLLDYPGKTACIVFTVGCNFRCGFCHNPNFVLPDRIAKIKNSFVKEEAFFHFLEKRIGLLDGVVICGGEPTMQHDLEVFVRRIKSMGFLVKLDTNGSNPEVLKKLLFPADGNTPLLDMVAMDIKRPIDDYEKFPLALGCDENLPIKIRDSMELLGKSGIKVEFRTTIIKGKHTEESVEKIIQEVSNFQKQYKTSVAYAIQNFRPGDTLVADYDGRPFLQKELGKIGKIGEKYGLEILVRE